MGGVGGDKFSLENGIRFINLQIMHSIYLRLSKKATLMLLLQRFYNPLNTYSELYKVLVHVPFTN